MNKKLRVRLTGGGIMRTIHRDTLLNARDLSHLLPAENLQRLLPGGMGVHFDFSQRGIVLLRPEGTSNAMLNGSPITSNENHHLTDGDIKLLHIGDLLLRAQVIHSHF
ncbi:MAG: hypothetical protein US70_C0013G0004 [Parcubacteria group bacterium GW2011_GWD2_38_11]|nr:MAG: hypothetical protein US70_C0013G0004 [Parcubacteria group bacterium GW2011_GWD2_38_11]